MKFKAVLWLLLLSSCSWCTETFQLTVKKTPSSNLLKNAEFMTDGNETLPLHWIFCDYSKKPGFFYSTRNGIFRLTTTGNLYGYLVQPQVPVCEGEKYYAEVEVRLNSRALLWVMTMQYDDKLGAFQEPKSSTKIYAIANPDHGAKLVEELKYFIPPDFLLPISETEWNRCAMEFTVPKGRNIMNYDFRIGAYGGKPGWIEVRKPVFSLSRQDVELTLNGRNLLKLTICHPDGTVINSYPLKPGQMKNQLNIILDSRLIRFFAEITDTAGVKHRRTL